MTKSISRKKIAYVSVVHALHDHRFLYKQCSGLVTHDLDVDYFVRHDRAEVIQGVNIKPLRSHHHRLVRFLSTFAILPKLLGRGYEAYHLVDPELIPVGILLKIITRKVVVFDAHEDYVAFLQHKGYVHKFALPLLSIGTRFILWLSGKVFDGLVFADPGTAEWFNVSASKRVLFYNFPLLSLFTPCSKPWQNRSYDLVYLGTMSRTSGLFMMLEAIASVAESRPNLRALFIGEPEGYIKDDAQRLIREKGIGQNVTFSGRVPHGDVPGMLCDCKVGLIGLKNLPKFQRNIATKMFEYMACAIPVVSSDLPPERAFMTDGEHCIFVPPEDPESMAAAINGLLSNPEKAEAMSQKCRCHVVDNGYSAEHEIQRLVEFYRMKLSC